MPNFFHLISQAKFQYALAKDYIMIGQPAEEKGPFATVIFYDVTSFS